MIALLIFKQGLVAVFYSGQGGQDRQQKGNNMKEIDGDIAKTVVQARC